MQAEALLVVYFFRPVRWWRSEWMIFIPLSALNLIVLRKLVNQILAKERSIFHVYYDLVLSELPFWLLRMLGIYFLDSNDIPHGAHTRQVNQAQSQRLYQRCALKWNETEAIITKYMASLEYNSILKSFAWWNYKRTRLKRVTLFEMPI